MSKITWLTPYFDAWKKEYGGEMSGGQAARALAPVRKEIGDTETLVRWEWYLRSTPAQYASPTKFAQIHGQYAPEFKPTVTENLGRRPLTMGRVV
jgi:hypothetical protein